MKKYIVTGGAGFIGSNLVDMLIERGDEVHIIDNLTKGTESYLNPKAIFHKLDIRNLEEIKPVFVGVDGVFHLAALPQVQYSIEHPVETSDINMGGTQNILLAAKEAGVKRVVYSASSAAYGDQEITPLVESMLPKPLSPYGVQKYTGEHFCRIWSEIHGLETVSLRYFNVYGPRQSNVGAYAPVIARFLKQKNEGKKMTITGDGLQTRDFTHVRDVARANILAMESSLVGRGEVINIGGGKEYTVLKIAQIIGGEYEFIAPQVGAKYSLADISLAKKLLDWEPLEDFEKGVEELKGMI